MKKLILILFLVLILPSLVFSQVSNKAQFQITGGINFPSIKQSFKDGQKTGFNGGLNFERPTGKSTVFGGSINFSHFASVVKGEDAVGVLGLTVYLKYQNNLLVTDDIQPYLKGGAGLGIIGDKKAVGHPSFPLPALAFDAGGGFNFLLSDERKIFLESSYRFFPSVDNKQYGASFINIGFSVPLK